jgi:hypothetical protein
MSARSPAPRSTAPEFVIAVQDMLHGSYKPIFFFDSSSVARSVARRLLDAGYAVRIYREKSGDRTELTP